MVFIMCVRRAAMHYTHFHMHVRVGVRRKPPRCLIGFYHVQSFHQREGVVQGIQAKGQPRLIA